MGSNDGNREEWLRKAIRAIEAAIGNVAQESAVYSTAAWGVTDQPDFLNMVVEVTTSFNAQELLQATQAIEIALGRQREIKWGPRTLDIDMLFFNSDVIRLPELTVPHPYLQERRFTLVPLAAIAPSFVHPLLGKTIGTLLTDCPDPLEVKLFSAHLAR